MNTSENPFMEKPRPKPRNWFITILQSLVIFSSITIVLYLFVITPNQVDGPSMEPNFHTYELLLVNRFAQWVGNTPLGKSLDMDYKRGDVIIFQKPGYPEFVKRVIGIPGDRIAIRDGYIFINGQKMMEDYLPPGRRTNGADFIEEGGESKQVPSDMVFAVGDNRAVSHDSRYSDIGFVKREWIKGRVIVRFWPLDTFSLISTGKYTLVK